MPIVADIVSHFPNAQIDWVVEEAYVDLVKLNPSVREVIPFSLRRWRRQFFSPSTYREIAEFKRSLQAKTYDVILDTQGLLKTGAIMGTARGAVKVGLANGTEGSGYESLSRIFHTLSVPVPTRTHAVTRGRLVAAHALTYAGDIEQIQPDFGLTAPDLQPDWLPNEDYVVFFYATAGAKKRWPAHDWITLGKHINSKGLPILLAWGNATEKLEAEQLASHTPNARVLPKLNMMEAIVLAQRAALVVGLDTGLTHIAAAYCRPTIEIYTGSPRWKTEGNWSDKIINLGDLGRVPTVLEVIDAVEKIGFRESK
jgi:heptosyltransferase-1